MRTSLVEVVAQAEGILNLYIMKAGELQPGYPHATVPTSP